MTNSKVFCKECKYFVPPAIAPAKSVPEYYPHLCSCDYPENVKEYNYEDTWYKRHQEIKFDKLKLPSEINKNNDCKWFEVEDDQSTS